MNWKLAVIGDPIAHSLSPVIQGQIKIGRAHV